LDLWHKDIAPSHELCKRFNHEPSKWNVFKDDYTDELIANPDAVSVVLKFARRDPVTLVYGAKNPEFNLITLVYCSNI